MCKLVITIDFDEDEDGNKGSLLIEGAVTGEQLAIVVDKVLPDAIKRLKDTRDEHAPETKEHDKGPTIKDLIARMDKLTKALK